jgi:hypothetical protein
LDKNNCGAIKALPEKVVLVEKDEWRRLLFAGFGFENFSLNLKNNFVLLFFLLFLLNFF